MSSVSPTRRPLPFVAAAESVRARRAPAGWDLRGQRSMGSVRRAPQDPDANDVERSREALLGLREERRPFAVPETQ